MSLEILILTLQICFHVTNDILNETDTESLIEGFYKACSTTLDTAAPLKHKSVKGGSQPWLNETTRALRQECQKAEWKWKKDKLHVSFDILKLSLSNYQIAVKYAKSRYFSQLIADNVKVVFLQLQSFLDSCSVLDKFKSVF